MLKPQEIGWQTRARPLVVGAKGWFRIPDARESECHANLEPGTPLTVVELHRDGTNDVTVCHGAYQHVRLPSHAVDTGLEFRIACPWLPEDHPKVQAYLMRKIVQLEMVDPKTEVSSETTIRAKEIERLQSILTRHGVQVPYEGDDQPK